MKITKVINIKTKFPKSTDLSVYQYIGRGSKWGNPFQIGKDGTREEVIEKYKKYIVSNKELMESLGELRGKTLGCFCKPAACHGQVLLKLILDRGNGRRIDDFTIEDE